MTTSRVRITLSIMLTVIVALSGSLWLLRDKLLLVSAAKCSAASARIFLSMGASANALDARGQVLHHSLRCRDLALITFFLEHGAAVNGRDRYGHSPLWLASAMGSKQAAALLLKHGAAIDGVEPDDSPLRAAIRNNHADLVEYLLSAGAQVSDGSTRDANALSVAASAGAADVIQQLVAAGVPVNSIDHFGETPLFHAARTDARTLGALLKAGATVNLRNPKGSTPLIEAARACRVENVGLLLDASADVSPRDAKGQSARELAAKCSNRAIVELLRRTAPTVAADEQTTNAHQ